MITVGADMSGVGRWVIEAVSDHGSVTRRERDRFGFDQVASVDRKRTTGMNDRAGGSLAVDPSVAAEPAAIGLRPRWGRARSVSHRVHTNVQNFASRAGGQRRDSTV